jgi:mono/diheme cytochrome c family protein
MARSGPRDAPPRRRRLVALAMVAASAQAAGSEALFKEHCGACHQADGAGTPGLAPPLKGAHWEKLIRERGYLPRVVAFGMTGSVKVGDTVFNGAMPPQRQLSDADLASVLNHVASTLDASVLPAEWRAYEADEVARIRATPHATIEQSTLRRKLLTR